MPSNLFNATASLTLCVYYQALTFFLGMAVFPFKKYLKENSYENILIFWITGFNVLAGTMTLLGSLSRIETKTVVLLNILFWGIIFFKRKDLSDSLSRYVSFRSDYFRDRQCRIFLFPFSMLALLMFFSCLVPPTKIDELAYGIYYTKRAMVEGSFTFAYSPLLSLTYMAVPIYNLWFYNLRAEYAPALNSLLCYILSVFVLLEWTKERFGRDIAIIAGLITAFSVFKVVSCVAPGDNALNFLLLLVFMMTSYDIYQYAAKKNIAKETHEIDIKFFTLHLIFFTAIICKLTTVVLMVPVMIFLYISLFIKKEITKKRILFSIYPSIILVPFFLKSHIFYRNIIFPLGLQIFGSGPFDMPALRDGLVQIRTNTTLISRNFSGLLKSPFLYMKDLQVNFLAWPFVLLSFFQFSKIRAFYAPAGLAAAYVTAFYLLPHCASRFYLGVIDFLVILGVAFFLNLFEGEMRRKWTKALKGAAFSGAVIVIIITVIYTSQFMRSFFTHEDRGSFLRPRIECFDTINWINNNLPKNNLLIVDTRGRYYYDIITESFHDTVFGKTKKTIQNNEAFYNLLKDRGVKFLMVVEYPGAPKSEYEKFCENYKFSQLIYENKDEIISGMRWNKPVRGKTVIYMLK